MTIDLSTIPSTVHDVSAPATGTCPFGFSATQAVENFDPFGIEYQLNPGEALKWARENAPIFFDAKLGYWVITRYDDVQEVFRDNVTFSPSNALEKITPLTQEAQEILKAHDFNLNRTLVNEDEPQHTARRRALAGAFDTKELAHHDVMVRKLVAERIEKFQHDGTIDLVGALLYDVPLTVAFHFLGVPEHDMELLHKYSVAHTVSTWGRPSEEEQAEIASSVGKFWQLAGDILEELRTTPDAEGWMPFSIRMQKEMPEIVTDSYLHSMMMAGIVAAHETTAHSGANAVKLILETPGLWQKLGAHPELIPNAIEECLRLSGGVAAWRRVTTTETDLAGVHLPKGAKLLMVSAAANRDPEVFPDPDIIDLYRDNSAQHLTFGYGSHQCLGKNLARLELQVILQELTSRFPDLTLADQEFTFVANTSFRGPNQLLVEWDPTAVQSPPADFPEMVFNGPSRELRTRQLRIATADDSIPGIRRLVLETTDGSPLPNWHPGAHIEVEAGGVNRHYSLCGNDPQAWEIAVALEHNGRGGSRWIHENAQEGTTLSVRGPRNNFHVNKEASHLILIAGGVGITPMLAMADDAKKRGITYELHYCGKNRETLAYLNRIERDHGDHSRLHISDEGTRLNIDEFRERHAHGVQLLACGPDRLTSALLKELPNWPEGSIRHETFTALNALDTSANEEFTVEINSTGETLTVAANTTLLEALESSGHDVYADCREGLCGTCEVGVLSGDIDHRDHLLSEREKETGAKILTCVSRGKSCTKLMLNI